MTQQPAHPALVHLGQIATDFVQTLPPSARPSFVQAAQRAVDDLRAIVDERDSLKAEVVALKMKLEPAVSAPADAGKAGG